MKTYDLLIIGGGINGTAIALDAAGRGLSVLLCEQNDLASGTSSMSSKLIHGGIRYLEYGYFHLVRNALKERDVLLHKAPHLIKPLRFIMPYQPAGRPKWLLKLGLWFYDHLYWGLTLPRSASLALTLDNSPLKKQFTGAFSYSDCQVDDARLVITNAIGAREHGADIRTRLRFVEATRGAHEWQVRLIAQASCEELTVTARCLINATGPWLDQILTGEALPVRTQLVKGSHLVVKKISEDAYLLENDDGRVIFVIPYGDYSLIGTTEIPYEGSPAAAAITAAEQDYLCQVVNRYLARPLSVDDIIWHYSGVRALKLSAAKTPTASSRDYVIEVDDKVGFAPCVSIIGGKVTTHRLLAEQTLDKLRRYFPQMKPAWTAKVVLPGGDIGGSFEAFYAGLIGDYPWMDALVLYRYARAYGSRVSLILAGKTAIADLGTHYGHGLYAAEIDYLKREEWALTVEDVLWRRGKLGLEFLGEEMGELEGGGFL